MKASSELKRGVQSGPSPLLSNIDQEMERCLSTYTKLRSMRRSLLLQGPDGRKAASADLEPFLQELVDKELRGILRTYARLKRLQRALVFAELAALCVFAVGSLTIFVALLQSQLLMSDAVDRTIEVAFLLGTATFFVAFLLRRLLLPKMRAGIIDRIGFCEEILGPGKKLPDTVCKIRSDCKPSHPTKADRVVNCLRFFVLFGGLVLELLLVVNTFHDFGLKRVHGDFFFTLDDTLELFFTAFGLLSTSLYLYSYYSKEWNKESRADCAQSEKTPFLRRPPNTLWVSFGIGLVSLGNRVLRGLEGTGFIKVSIPGGFIRVGLLFATLLCLSDIYLMCKTQEELITSDLADASVSARVVPLVTDNVP